MYLYKGTTKDLDAASKATGLVWTRGTDKGKGISFRVSQPAGTTNDSAYVPHSFNLDGTISRRKRSNVCIHGHLAFFKWLFRSEPNAEIVSGLSRPLRITADNLQDWYEELCNRSISDYLRFNHGLTMNDACNCESHFPHLLQNVEDMNVHN